MTTDQAYEATITTFLPGLNDWQMSVRIELARMRDQALTGVRRADNDTAILLLREIGRVAAELVYAEMPASRLMRAHSGLWLMMQAAQAMEAVQRNG